MIVRSSLACLGLLSTLYAAPAAAELRACESGSTFDLREVWPADGETDVPTDGIVVLIGDVQGDAAPPNIQVLVDDIVRDGEIEPAGGGLYVWKGGPFAPNTTYTIDLGEDATGARFSSFTTGAGPSEPPAAPDSVTLEIDQEEVEVVTCVDGLGVCCNETRTDVQLRMIATLALPSAPAPFGPVTRALVELAPDPDSFGDLEHTQAWSQSLVIDFGEPGTWNGEQVCARVSALDPLDRAAAGEVVCQPIGNVDTVRGCSVTGEPAPLLLLVLIPLLRRRRRA